MEGEMKMEPSVDHSTTSYSDTESEADQSVRLSHGESFHSGTITNTRFGNGIKTELLQKNHNHNLSFTAALEQLVRNKMLSDASFLSSGPLIVVVDTPAGKVCITLEKEGVEDENVSDTSYLSSGPLTEIEEIPEDEVCIKMEKEVIEDETVSDSYSQFSDVTDQVWNEEMEVERQSNVYSLNTDEVNLEDVSNTGVSSKTSVVTVFQEPCRVGRGAKRYKNKKGPDDSIPSSLSGSQVKAAMTAKGQGTKSISRAPGKSPAAKRRLKVKLLTPEVYEERKQKEKERYHRRMEEKNKYWATNTLEARADKEAFYASRRLSGAKSKLKAKVESLQPGKRSQSLLDSTTKVCRKDMSVEERREHDRQVERKRKDGWSHQKRTAKSKARAAYMKEYRLKKKASST